MFVHYCLSPLAGSINKHPSSLSVYLTCSINHPPRRVFFSFSMHPSFAGALCLFIVTLHLHKVSSDLFVKDGKAITLLIDSRNSFVIMAERFLGPVGAALICRNRSAFWETHSSASFEEMTDNKGKVHDTQKCFHWETQIQYGKSKIDFRISEGLTN